MQIQNIRTPGVYVQEIPTLAPSVAPVATAIPVFIGYTEKGPSEPTRIETMLDYETLFGGAYLSAPTVTVTSSPGNGPSPVISHVPDTYTGKFLMYYALSLYFQNGGGSCYILSVGTYYGDDFAVTTPSKQPYLDALTALRLEDEPTLIVMPDATTLNDPKTGILDYYDLCSQALQQCADLGDRFLIVDLPDGDKKAFRNNIGVNNLSYGAAYFPYLNSMLSLRYDENKVSIAYNYSSYRWSSGASGYTVSYNGTLTTPPSLLVSQSGSDYDFNIDLTAGLFSINIPTGAIKAKDLETAWNVWKSKPGNKPQGFNLFSTGQDPNKGTDAVTVIDNKQVLTNVTTPTVFSVNDSNIKKSIQVTYIGAANETPSIVIAASSSDPKPFVLDTSSAKLTINLARATVTATELVNAWINWKSTNPRVKFDIKLIGNGKSAIGAMSATTLIKVATTLSAYQDSNTALYNQVKTYLSNQSVTLPPSAAIAGVYARVDRERGVWKAPANVSLNGVIGPLVKISDTDQDDLNVDPTGGKSINAIRSFTGKGTLVWGARTLAGNDNEWRYVSVRRLFINIEESARKASAFAVFEPNDATTWLKVKAMIESYLYGLWQQGALAGSKPESAYFVSVGLGKSMTAQDILEGRMIVNIGIAAVRPAEFIILTFSHKMQEA